MKKLALGITSLLLVITFAMPLGAQDITCADVSFDEQIMATYPLAPDACQEIIEVEGVRYAHFKALVHREGFPSMLLRFRHGDSWGPATLVQIPAGYKVYQGDQPVDAKDVARGGELSFYMPEGRWQVPMADAEAMVVEEAAFEPLVFEVTDVELTEEVDMEAPALAVADAVQEAGEDAAGAAGDALDEVSDAAGDAYDSAADNEWLWILGLAGAFIIVWFLLRRRKARREG